MESLRASSGTLKKLLLPKIKYLYLEDYSVQRPLGYDSSARGDFLFYKNEVYHADPGARFTSLSRWLLWLVPDTLWVCGCKKSQGGDS
jgi:hypothetical protein